MGIEFITSKRYKLLALIYYIVIERGYILKFKQANKN